MTDPATRLLPWLVRHAGFPARRLPREAELLLLFAAAAAESDNPGDDTRSVVVRQDPALIAAQRQRAENRRRVHFKCDNRTAV
jgi:hypothetical protein